MEYRKNAHSVWDVKYHMIWAAICQGGDVVIVQGAVSPDHVHMLVSVPPQLAPTKLVQYLKGRSRPDAAG